MENPFFFIGMGNIRFISRKRIELFLSLPECVAQPDGSVWIGLDMIEMKLERFSIHGKSVKYSPHSIVAVDGRSKKDAYFIKQSRIQKGAINRTAANDCHPSYMEFVFENFADARQMDPVFSAGNPGNIFESRSSR